MAKTRGLKVLQGTHAKHLHPATVIRIQSKRREIPQAMVEIQLILSNGALFTRLKPGIANGAEFAETWKEYGL